MAVTGEGAGVKMSVAGEVVFDTLCSAMGTTATIGEVVPAIAVATGMGAPATAVTSTCKLGEVTDVNGNVVTAACAAGDTTEIAAIDVSLAACATGDTTEITAEVMSLPA